MGKWSTAGRLGLATTRGIWKASTALSESVDAYVAGRGARRGVLRPGDPTPPPGSGDHYFDYRGLFDAKSVAASLSTCPGFPIGVGIDPGRGITKQLRLPREAIDSHALVVGPSGAGKTTSLIVPWIRAGLELGYSVVTIDVKGDLCRQVMSGFSVDGVVTREIDYRNPDSTTHWNWVNEIRGERAVDAAVSALLGLHPPPGTDPFFFDQDSRHLRGLLEWSVAGRLRAAHTTASLIARLESQEEVVKHLSASRGAFRGLADLADVLPEDYHKAISGVVSKLDPLARSSIEQLSQRATFKLDDIGATQSFISLVAPIADGRTSIAFSSLFINLLLHRVYDRFGSSHRPLILVIDEAARLRDRIDYGSLLSISRGAGMSVILALQDVDQFPVREERNAVLANCGTMVALKGCSAGTAEVLSLRLGTAPVTSVGRSRDRGHSGLSLSTSAQPLLGAREIMAPPFSQRAATVHAATMGDRPFLVDLHY